MSYPIYQQQNRRNYPEGSTTIVNWAGAGEKIMQGITEGVELGLKIKNSRENSLLNAARIRDLDNSSAIRLQSLALEKQRTDAEVANHAVDAEIKKLQLTRAKSAAVLQAQASADQLEFNTVQRQIQADSVLTQNDAIFNDMQANAANIKLAMETTNDPSIRQQHLDLLNEDWNQLQEATGVEPTKLAMSLRKDDPRAQQLAMLNPVLAQKQYLLDMLVPIKTSVLTQTEFDASDPNAAAIGKQSFDKNTTSTTMVPLSVARSHWQAGQSLETFTSLRDNAADSALFDKWAKSSGLGKLIATPTPTPVAPTAPAIAPLAPNESANPVITEKAADAARLIASQSPLEKETGSLFQKLREAMTTRTAATLGLLIPGAQGMAIPMAVRQGAEDVKWLADKTGIGITEATKLRDKIREWLPQAEDARNQFNADPKKVDANNKYWDDQKDAINKEIQTADPKRQKVLQKTLELLNPPSTSDTGAKVVAEGVTMGGMTLDQINQKIKETESRLQTQGLSQNDIKLGNQILESFKQKRAAIMGR